MKINPDHKCSNKRAFDSNIKLHELGLAFQNFGNASGRNRTTCLIKPSGIDINKFISENIVSVSLKDNQYSDGYKPSSDTPTHIELYNAFPEIGGIVHTHSIYATSWAQAAKPIPCLGTTHSDYWNGEVPITRQLTDEEINGDYEKETGKVIIEKIDELKIDPIDCPGILVSNHGPFTWGVTVEDAVKNAELLEYIAKLAWMSLLIKPDSSPISKALLNKHFSRKHGPDAYYGQDSK